MGWRPWFDSRQEEEYFSRRHRFHTVCWAHPASYLVGIGSPSAVINLITHVHLVSRLRMRGAIPPLPHTYFWRGASLSARASFHVVSCCGGHFQKSIRGFMTCNLDQCRTLRQMVHSHHVVISVDQKALVPGTNVCLFFWVDRCVLVWHSSGTMLTKLLMACQPPHFAWLLQLMHMNVCID
jgi:hypothetical protein